MEQLTLDCKQCGKPMKMLIHIDKLTVYAQCQNAGLEGESGCPAFGTSFVLSNIILL